GAHADPRVRRRVAFAAEARPALVDGDDAAVPVHHRDAVAQRGENGRLHQFARPESIHRLLARQSAGEDLGNESQPLDLLLWPGPFGSERIKREAAEYATAGHQRDGQLRADASRPECVLVLRRFVAMVLRAREDKGLLAEQPLDGFGKTANDDAPRPWIDSRSDPAVGDDQKLMVFGEPEKGGAVQPEKLTETSEPRSERLVHLGAGKVHERAGKAGEQLLEAEA